MRYNHTGRTIGRKIMSEITIPNAAEMIERTVKPVGGGAQVHVPKTWMGCCVAVVKLED